MKIIRNSLILMVASATICFALPTTINTPVEQIVKVYRITNDIDITRSIIIHCKIFNVPPALALSIAYNESKFNPKCIYSNKDSKDIGVFQLNTKSYHKYTIKELMHIDTNVKFGVSHLAGNLSRNKYNINRAIAAYNAGQSRVNRGTIPKSTKEYVSKVIKTTLEFERRLK